MKFTKEFIAEMERIEQANKVLELGLHKSYVHEVMGGKDQLGLFLCLVMEQADTHVRTAPCNPDEIRYKDVAKVHCGNNRLSSKGYCIQEGAEWKRFFAQIREQFPELAKKNLDWVETAQFLEGKTLKVWYTRSKKGYLNCHFSEQAYQFDLDYYGATGGEDEITAEESKTLNEDCPF